MLTADVLRKLDVPTEKFNAEFEAIMRVGRERLLALQQPTGGFSWFDRGPEDPVMTAIVVHGLSECDRLGYKVDAVSLKRGRDRLRLFAKEESDLNRLAYQSYVLGEEYDRVLEKRAELSPYSLSLLALSLHRAGRPEAKDVVKLLVASVSGDHWETPNWRNRWEPMGIETTAYALQALVAVEPGHALIPMGREWLLSRRSGNRWHSTKDTAVAISTLLQITGMERLGAAVSGDGKGAAKGEFLKKVGVSLNGGEPREILVDLNNPTRSTLETYFRDVRAGSNVLAFHKLDEQSDFTFDVEVTKRLFEAKVDAASQGVEVKVSYDRALDGLRLGDELTATVVVSSSEAAEYVMVQSPIPAGCEVIRGSGTGPFARFEDRYEKALFFLPSLAKEEVRLTYRMRCSIAGRFTVLPAWAGLMYNEDIFGTTGAATATIKP